jgi:hypothetical protein
MFGLMVLMSLIKLSLSFGEINTLSYLLYRISILSNEVAGELNGLLVSVILLIFLISILELYIKPHLIFNVSFSIV